MLSLIKRTVLENMTPPMNLLINGDFKINQRGKGSYASNGIEGWTNTVDCWKISNLGNISLTVNDGYVTFASTGEVNQYSYLQQKIEISMSGLYTIVTNINGNIYTFQFDTSNSSIIQKYSGFNILVSYDGQYLRFTFMFTEKGTSINIYYARIDKGNIAYAHVPEDYAIALARCQTRLYGIVNDSPSQYVPLGVCYAENASLLYAGVDVPCLMDTPNIEVDALDLRLIQSKGVGISNVSVVNYANGKLYLAITPSANVTAGSVYLLGLYGGKTIAFSCES